MKCFISKCFNYYPSEDKSISFFSFPVKPEKRDLWLRVLPPYNRPYSRFSKICSEHFAKSDIVVHNKIKRLTPNAAPCVNIEDEEESKCTAFVHEEKPTTQILENKLPPMSKSSPEQTDEKHKPALEIELVPSSNSVSWPKDRKRKTPIQIEYPMSKSKTRKTKRIGKQSLEWALETADEDGIHCEPILRKKLEILRSFIISTNLDYFEQ